MESTCSSYEVSITLKKDMVALIFQGEIFSKDLHNYIPTKNVIP